MVETTSAAPAPSFTVMTYNIRHCAPPEVGLQEGIVDVERTAAVINAHRPDLVALQEVDRCTTRSDGNVDQAAELGRLTGMHHFFARAKDVFGGQYGDAVLSRFPILEAIAHQLPVADPEAELRSMALIRVRSADRELIFASTHLCHFPHDNRNRDLQAQTLVQRIPRDTDVPMVIGADLNAAPDSSALATLSTRWQPIRVNGQWPLTFRNDNPTRTLDYVLVDAADRIRARSMRVVDDAHASDHFPLLAEFEWIDDGGPAGT